MPQRRGYYGGGRQQPRDFNEFFTIGRMIRDQVTGEDRRQQQMNREFESLELEEAQARVKEIKDRQISQERQGRLLALQANRQGDIQALQAKEGTPGPTLASFLGGSRQAQLGGEAGTMMNLPTEPGGMQLLPVQGGATMDLPIPDVQLPHKTMQVRGIQIPEMGIDIPGYSQRPQSMQQMRDLLVQQELAKSMVQVPEQFRQPGGVLAGLPELPAEVHEDWLTLYRELVEEQGRRERLEAGFGQETAERKAEQLYETGKIGRGQVFKSGEAVKTRVSTAEQKRLDREAEAEQKRLGRESTERIAGMRQGPKTEEEKLLAEANVMRKAEGLEPLTELPQRPQPGIPPVARAEEASELHIEAPNGRNFTAVMAQRYKEKAGGDLQLAIDMAIEDGWRLPAGFQTGK